MGFGRDSVRLMKPRKSRNGAKPKRKAERIGAFELLERANEHARRRNSLLWEPLG